MCLGRGLLVLLLLTVTACGGGGPAKVTKRRSPGYPQPYHLLGLFKLNNTHLRQTAALLGKTGNDREIGAAAAELIGLANTVGSDEWREAQRPRLASIDKQEAMRLTRAQQNGRLDSWQKRYLVRIYDAMGALGGKIIMAHCRATVKNENRRKAEQQLALAVLDKHDLVDRTPSKQWAMPGATPPAVPSGRMPGATRYPAGRPGTHYPSPPTQPGAPRARPTAPEPPRVRGGHIINVNQVVDALRPYFKTCYQRALSQYGRFGAWVILNATVASDGRVSAVSGSVESVPVSMMACLKGVMVQARFAPPVGGSAVVEVPLTFTR